MQIFHQNKFLPKTILQRHRCCVWNLAPPKNIVIGLKKRKQCRECLSPMAECMCGVAREIGLAMQDTFFSDCILTKSRSSLTMSSWAWKVAFWHFVDQIIDWENNLQISHGHVLQPLCYCIYVCTCMWYLFTVYCLCSLKSRRTLVAANVICSQGQSSNSPLAYELEKPNSGQANHSCDGSAWIPYFSAFNVQDS